MPQASKKAGLSGPSGCIGPLCDWGFGKSGLGCVDGSGGCEIAMFLEAEASSFHPEELEEATKKINRILKKIPPDPKGRKLSFCSTNMGTFLAWVFHEGKPLGSKAVTRRDDDAKVAKALKLKKKKY